MINLRRVRRLLVETRNNHNRGIGLFGGILTVYAGNYVYNSSQPITSFIEIALLFISAGLIDRYILHIWQNENKDNFSLNPDMVKMRNDLDAIRKKLGVD